MNLLFQGELFHQIWKLEKLLGIVIGDIPYNFPDPFHIVWQKTCLNVISQDIAKDPSVIFMSWEGQKASAVRQHAHRTAQESHVGSYIQLLGYPILLVQKPPCRPKLDLALYPLAGKVARHGRKDFVVRRI